MAKKERTITTYGVIEIGWGTSVMLPLDEAAELLQLISDGIICRQYVDGQGYGYTYKDDEGRYPTPPSLEVLSIYQKQERFDRGHAAQVKRKAAAEGAAERNLVEFPSAAE